MLSKPSKGWSEIKIGSFVSRISYLTDVPMDCLKGCISALENNLPVAISFDAEGWEFVVVSSFSETFIILNDESGEYKYMVEDFTMFNFVKGVVDDIESNLDEWLMWDEEAIVNRGLFQSKLEQLKILFGERFSNELDN